MPMSCDFKEGSQRLDVRVSAAHGDSCDIYPRPTTAINFPPALDVQARLSWWRNADQTSLNIRKTPQACAQPLTVPVLCCTHKFLEKGPRYDPRCSTDL